MKRIHVKILAVTSGLVVCGLFMYFFRDRLDKLTLILIGAALAMVIAEGIRFIGRKMI